MLKQRLRGLLFGSGNRNDWPQAAETVSGGGMAPGSGAILAAAAAEYSRHSHGLEQFCGSIRDECGLSILDLGEICQPNVSFITSLGHRLYSEDFLRTLDSVNVQAEPDAGSSQTERMETFLRESLHFPAQHFDAALAWDTLEYLAAPMLLTTVDRLYEVLRPQACLLAFFHADERAESVPHYSYRISNERTLMLAPRGHRQPAQYFNNRGIEKLFHRFHSVKFFLTRDHLREVIVKR